MKQKNDFARKCGDFWQVPKHYIYPLLVLLLFGFHSTYAKEPNNNKLPEQTLLFEENKGQFATGIKFKALDKQAHYSFLKNAIDVSLPNLKNEMAPAYKMKFLGANATSILKGEDKTINPQFGIRNYITENGKISNVPFFKEILYEELWNHIDASFYNSMEGLKYDFIIKPGGNPDQIKVELDGVEKLKVNARGELEFLTAHGKLFKGSPYTYQIINGKKHTIKSKYKVDNAILSFELEDYNKSYPVIIDPIALKYATVLGNAEVSYEIVASTLDAAGSNIYFIADVDSTITDIAEDFVNIGCMKADGTGLLWTTTLYGIGTQGSETYNEGIDIQVNNTGDVFFTFESAYAGSIGLNKSALILGPHPIFPANPALGVPTSDDGYVLARLSADGATLKYFTYIGATKEHTYLSNLIVDGDIVTVAQELDDFDRVYSNLDRTYLNVIPPTPGSINTISNSSGVASDGTGLFRYNTAVAGQGSLVKAAYFGRIIVKKIKKDNSGNIFLVGTDYKQSSGYQPDFWSSNPITKYQDINNFEQYPFLLKVDYALSTILYASPIGGRSIHPEQSSFSSYNLSSNGIGIDIDNENNIIFSCVISLVLIFLMS